MTVLEYETHKDITESRLERAKRLTERIAAKSRELWADIKEMRDERLYREMGYETIDEWAEAELGWGKRHVHLLAKAADIMGVLEQKVIHGSLLPTSERQIRPLAYLEKHDDFSEHMWVDAWNDAVAMAKAEDRAVTAKDVQFVVGEMLYEPPPPLPDGKYRVIYADPPWRFDNSGFDESAASHYPTMKTTDIAELTIPQANVCFMWATNAMLEDALFVLDAWGFDYKTNMAWMKDAGPSIGWYVQSRHELLLIGTSESGNTPEWKPPSWFRASASEHSRKPDLVYDLIEKMYEGPYLELFARRKYGELWTVWGNEAPQSSPPIDAE